MSHQDYSIFDYTKNNNKNIKHPKSRKEEAYRRILEIVLSREIGSNDFLNEQPLAEQFGMSRAPVREALHMLCSERILENVPRLGYRVIPISISEVLDAISVRLILEKESVHLACHNRNPAALAKLDSLIVQEKKLEEEESTIHTWILQGDLVHRTIAELAGNRVLLRTLINLIDLLRRASIQLILDGVERPSGVHYHKKILEAVRSSDEKAAVDLVSKDCLILKDLILRKE